VALFITIAMPLDPAIGYAMVVLFFEDRLIMTTIPKHVNGFFCLLLAHMDTCLRTNKTQNSKKSQKKSGKNRDGQILP
jgi:hypothetical protein